MIYLLETGFCLSLLYLAYWLFLRKETYFNFNRLFLVGSIAITLIVPVLHLNLFIPQGSSLENPAKGIIKVRSSYEEMIRMIDADFGTEPGSEHSFGYRGTGEAGLDEGGRIPMEGSHGIITDQGDGLIKDTRFGNWFSWTRILIIIYIGGVVYFLARFVYLVIRLYLLAKRNRVTRQEGFRMVEIKEDISPFSFFRFLFINNGTFNDSELYHVLEHEKAHIRQKHSMDHLFAHGLAVFQWFNPFAWQMSKALKTTHEYIADRQVIDRGIEMFDYQSLLLKQVIGYHSVELVNNFNLKPIKKRIAMMNKSRSGVPAKFKAMLVAPVAILVFFLFADFTLRGSSATTDPVKELSGLWIKQSDDNFSKALYIEDGKFSYMDGTEIMQFDAELQKGVILLNNGDQFPMKYELSGDELRFAWNKETDIRYKRSLALNTLDQFQLDHGLELNLPYISQYRLLEKEELIYRIGIGLDNEGKAIYTFNGKSISIKDLPSMVKNEKSRLSLPEQQSLIGLFLIDKEVPMSMVNEARGELRKIDALYIAEGGYPQGEIHLSPLLYHSVALPRLLPPMDAKVLDKEAVEQVGGIVHTIDLSAKNSTPRDVDQNLQKFIGDNKGGKYVLSLEFDDQIPYGQYVETVDMIFNVIYRFRKELALERYKVPYDQLGDDLQREIRKAYPMALSESLVEK